MIDRFREEYFFLSNFSPSKIEINNLVFDNAEAAFHSFKDPGRPHEFVGLNPSEAKKLGRKVRLRSDWEEVKDHVMYRVVLAKFVQNPDLREKLLATHPKELIEGNDWNDTYWGVCNGIGKNRLGMALMLVRDHLRRTERIKELIES